MIITAAKIEFELPFIQSKKGRRKIISSIKQKLQNKNISVIDLSGEYPKEGLIGFCFVSLSSSFAKNKIQNIQEFLEKNYPEVEFFLDYEIF